MYINYYCSAPRILLKMLGWRLPHVFEDTGITHARQCSHHPGNELCNGTFKYDARKTCAPDDGRGCALGPLSLSRVCTPPDKIGCRFPQILPDAPGRWPWESVCASTPNRDPVYPLGRALASTGSTGVCLSTTRESAVPTTPTCTQ